MFKKLKEKITEEVKISPQRFAEFTQSVSDRLQNSTTSDDNFFSIGDEDANASGNSNNGFSSVMLVSPSQESRSRKHSNSSIMSDISFLPKYEAGSTYHLQSDLDISASEIEDNVSTASSQLGHLSKEQIYSAFQKSQMRYHKYRGRYTDLARHYKDLERENQKMKGVLTETQDKSIRRVAELKEQCSLEQKAKAHLESALRDEIDEKNYKIKTLQMKIQLLQNDSSGPSSIASLESKENDSQGENLENLTKYLTDARREIENLNEKIQELKANAIVYQSKEKEYKTKIASLEKENSQFNEREKETNLKFAQNKMELHNEILSKEMEITNLKKDMEVLKQNLETQESDSKSSNNTKLENLQAQNKKLIEKLENSTKKCNNLEAELVKVESYKSEIERLNNEMGDLQTRNSSLLKEVESYKEKTQSLSEQNEKILENIQKEKEEFKNQIETLREDAKKGLLSLEPKIKDRLHNEFLQREDELKQDFAKRVEELSANNANLKEFQMKLLEKDEIIKKLNKELEQLDKKVLECNNLEKNHLELIENCTELRNTISVLEKEKLMHEGHKEKKSRLEAHIHTLQEELKHLRSIFEHKEVENVALSKENFNLQQNLSSTTEKLRILEEKYEAINLDTLESKLLQLQVQRLEEEKNSLLKEFEMERKMFNEMLQDNKELKTKEEEVEILRRKLNEYHRNITDLEEKLTEEREKNVHLYDKKLHFEKEVEKLHETIRIFEEKVDAEKMDKTQCGLLELKLQKLEEENRRLLDSFELERLSFARDLDVIKQDLSSNEIPDDTTDQVQETDLKHRLNVIKQLLKTKETENVYLSKENLKLQQKNNHLSGKVRLLEEKLEVIQLEGTESKLLELKVQKLEEENNRLVAEFEMERKMFNSLLENHKELHEKEQIIEKLEESLHKIRKKELELKDFLTEEKKVNVKLAEEKLVLEKTITKLQEKIRIFEEKDEALSIDKTECSLLELKLQKLENENQSLLDNFEKERAIFNKTYKQHAELEKTVQQLIEENMSIKECIKKGKEEIESLNLKLKEHIEQLLNKKEKINELSVLNENLEKEMLYLKELNHENVKLKHDLQYKDKQVSELSTQISNLSNIIEKQTSDFNNLSGRTRELDEVLEKIQKDNIEAIKKEKESQNELTSRIEDLQREVEVKTADFTLLSEKLSKLEALHKEEQTNYQEKLKETDLLKHKISDLEKKYEDIIVEKNTATNELKSIEKEKIELEIKLGELENNLDIKNCDIKSCEEEKIKLLNDIENLQLENRNLKVISAQNTNNQNEEANNEMIELNNRIKDLSDENRVLLRDKEELNTGLEYTNQQLLEAQKQIALLTNDKKQSDSSETDIVKIQEEFYEIKQKCDNLFVENKNLKLEYNKLEEKCNNFSKIKENLTSQINELEKQYTEIIHEKQLLQDEIQELKISPVNYPHPSTSKLDSLNILKKADEFHMSDADKENCLKEIEILREKLIQYKSLDLTNKSSIEFYENELQKMKNQNEKLNRKLDETLVTLNHCTELSTSTEIEYLKNVLYNYMLGKESLVLARVIAAVCKFDPQQTETVLQKEQQKQTLLGQLGLI